MNWQCSRGKKIKRNEMFRLFLRTFGYLSHCNCTMHSNWIFGQMFNHGVSEWVSNIWIRWMTHTHTNKNSQKVMPTNLSVDMSQWRSFRFNQKKSHSKNPEKKNTWRQYKWIAVRRVINNQKQNFSQHEKHLVFSVFLYNVFDVCFSDATKKRKKKAGHHIIINENDDRISCSIQEYKKHWKLNSIQ